MRSAGPVPILSCSRPTPHGTINTPRQTTVKALSSGIVLMYRAGCEIRYRSRPSFLSPASERFSTSLSFKFCRAAAKP